MPAYTYRCPQGHVTEHVQSIHDPLPATVDCKGEISATDVCRLDVVPPIGDRFPDRDAYECASPATRVIDPPISVHYKAPGFYSTDVKARQERRRRPNAGDDLFRPHDAAAARIARSL